MKRKEMKKFYRDIEKSILRTVAGTTRKHYYRDLWRIKKAINKHDGREDVITRLSKKKQYKAFIRYLLIEIQESEEEEERLRDYIKELEIELDDYRSYEGGEFIPE